MSEDANAKANALQELISNLEELQNCSDDAEYANKNHLDTLKSINILISRNEEITSTDADRVLKLCLHYKTDLPCVTHMVSIISSLINIDKTKPFSPPLDFVQSSLTILDFLKSLHEEPQAVFQRTLAIHVLMLHPTDALTELIRCHCSKVIQLFMTYMYQDTQDISSLEIKMEIVMLLKLLDILPDAEKAMFVKEGIPVWFTHVIPILIQYLIMFNNKDKQEQYLHFVELLVQELTVHDYFDYPEWQKLLESICSPKMFPLYVKLLLEKGKDNWHRVWILIIKLLKSHITLNSSFGTPINSMLPVVETAFKREPIQRIRAFKCWKELIDNFSQTMNENTIEKRIRLVMIPLRLNNAKTEETTTEKLLTWWHLIRMFKVKLDSIKEVVILFLHFMFGKVKTPKFWVGQIGSALLRKQCLEAFVEMVGHSDCTSTCVTNIPPLNGRILDITMLIDNWEHWYYSLKVAIKMAALTYSPGAKANTRCIWKSLVSLVADLPDNNIRRDLFNELVKMMQDLIQDCCLYSNLEDILMDDLMLPLFNDDKIKHLLTTKSQENRPMHKILKLMTCKTLEGYYKRLSSEDLMDHLKPLANALAAEVMNPLCRIGFLDDLLKTDASLTIWTALVEVLVESEHEKCLTVLKSILLWPFKSLGSFSDVKQPALSWNTLYNAVHMKLNTIGFDNDLLEALPKPDKANQAVNYFTVFAYIALMKQKLLNMDNMKNLEELTSRMADYRDFEEVIPPLVDSLVVMLDHVTTEVDDSLAQTTINCVINVLRIIITEMKSGTATDTTEVSAYDKSLLLGSLLRPVTSLFRVNTYTPIILNFINELKQYISSLKQGTVLYATILSIMKTYLSNCSNEVVKTDIRYSISLLENTEKNNCPKELNSPIVTSLVKKSKKKEANITNTVVLNGEEYVVVKSNWKFNPKNLTEHQKEKLTRKRDIPALYQDLSQSQDEFKLSSWKTDSQDTSLSSSKSSKSTANNNASEILRNMPSTNVVPKIMENILPDNDNNVSQKPDTIQSPVSKNKLVIDEMQKTPKGTKSPRMAFKDRVFRNVRNLIEKSSPQMECKINNNDDQVENVSKSPVGMNIELAKSSVSKSQVDDTIAICNAENKQNSSDTSNTSVKKVSSDNIPISKKKAKNAIEVYDSLSSKLMATTQETERLLTPVTKKKEETNAPNSAPPLLGDRPARMKRKPKKYEESLLLLSKKKRLSQSYTQSEIERPETTIAQIHDMEKRAEDEESKNESKEGNVSSKSITMPFKKVVSETYKVSVQTCDQSKIDKINTESVIILDGVKKDILNKPVTHNIDIQDVKNDQVEKVSEAANNNVTLDSLQNLPKEPSVSFIENLGLQKVKIPDSEIVGIPEILPERIRTLGRSPSVETSVGQDCANEVNEQPNIQSTVKDISIQKSLNNKSLVPIVGVNNIERLDITGNEIENVPHCSVRKKIHNETAKDKHMIQDTSLNKTKDGSSAKCTTKEIDDNNEISDCSTVKTKDKDTTQLSKQTCKENYTHKNQDTMIAISTPLPLKEIEIGEDKLDESPTKTSKRNLTVVVKRMQVTDLIKDFKQVAIPCKPAKTKILVSPPNSSVKSSLEQHDSTRHNEQLDKQSTPIQHIKNKQNTDTDTLTPVKNVIDLSKIISLKRNVIINEASKNIHLDVDTPSNKNKGLLKADETEMSKDISGSSIANPLSLDKVSSGTIPEPLDDLKKTSRNNIEVHSDDPTKAASSTNVTTISVISTKKTPPRQRLAAVSKKQLSKTQDCEKVGKPGKHANKLRRGRPKSIVKTSLEHDNSKRDTSLKNIRNQPKAETPNKSSVKNNVNNEGKHVSADVDHLLNKSIDEITANVTVDSTRLTPSTQVKNTTEKTCTKNKKSRIEKQLMIETVEGHPFLKAQTEKRMTRESRNRRKITPGKLQTLDVTPKCPKRSKEKKLSPSTDLIVEENQERKSNTPENLIADACSEDFIESSQDSNTTTLSVTKKTPLLLPIVVVNKLRSTETQDLIRDCENIPDIPEKSDNHESKEDISLPHNKTAEIENDVIDLTENMDTESMGDDNVSEYLAEPEPMPIVVDSGQVIGPATQELANADTQPNVIPECEYYEVLIKCETVPPEEERLSEHSKKAIVKDLEETKDDNDIIQTLPDDALGNIENTTEVSSPFKGDDQRKQEFLNSTLEISPIKMQSPDREKKSPSPETNSDFEVIKLTSPVHSNGEPFEKNGSPEFFTEEKISPEKRDGSPLRTETSVNNSSPSSSLSLKKRHQVRPGGRAAQMLGLLSVSSDNMLKVTKSSDRLELEEPKNSNTCSAARRNLRILYSSVGENSDLVELKMGDAEENILKLKRALPTVTSSPSGPILKRKHVDITDETTTSPASKRKRVSFHDPPVSTTVSVYKYIEPFGIRSPQSSIKKRYENPMRSGIKSPKRLDTAFHLDSVLSKTVESFDMNSMETEDTQTVSLDITPAVEIVKTSELNDTDPIFPDLVDCKDSIEVIAEELSSPAMRDLLVRELKGKLETVGDLAKMTELEVNRLCIKAPKVQVAKKVLSLYATKPSTIEVEPVIDEVPGEMESLPETTTVEMPANVIEVNDVDLQTVSQPVDISSTLNISEPAAQASAEIDESDSRKPSEAMTARSSEGEDLKHDKVSELQTDILPANSLLDLAKECNNSMTDVMTTVNKLHNKLKELHNKLKSDDKDNSQLASLIDYLCLIYNDKDLIFFCSQLLQKIGGTGD